MTKNIQNKTNKSVVLNTEENKQKPGCLHTHNNQTERMKLNVYMVLILILSCYATFTTSTSMPINVSLGFIAPLHDSLDPLGALGQELESAFKLAVQAVNKAKPSRVKIRTDFSVGVKDETANPADACKSAASYFSNDDKFVGIVGGYSSTCSVAMQGELKRLKSEIPQVSYRSPSIDFLDTTTYPSFFRTTSNNRQQAHAIIDIIKHFRWSHASIIHTDDLYYGKELSDEIISKAAISGILIKERVSFTSGDSTEKLDKKLQVIKTSGSRINIIVAQGKDVFTIFNRIKAKNMHGEGWVWIGSDGVTELNLGLSDSVNTTSSGLIGTAPESFTGPSFLKIVIAWYSESEEDYPGIVWKSQSDPNVSPYVAQVYRAVSAYHTLLNQLAEENAITTTTPAKTIRKLLVQKLKKLKDAKSAVDVILGNGLYFDKETDDRPIFAIRNCVDGKCKDVGSWNANKLTKIHFLSTPTNQIIWPGGGSQTPTDKGKPGKALFRLAFIAPTNRALGTLSEYGRELVSAFKVAIDIINNDKRYQIELDGIIKDEGVDGIDSCDIVGQEIKALDLVGVVGAYRSQCSIKLHKVLESKMMPIVSYASPAAILSNKTEYKNFFRLSPSDKHQSEILKQIVRKYGFKEVSTLYSNEISSKGIAKRFEELIKDDTVTLTASVEFPQHSHSSVLRTYVEKIRQSGSRVILVSALPKDATLLQQIIKELNMAGQGFIWLGSDGATTLNFPKNSDVAKELEGMLGINPKKGDGALYYNMLSTWLRKDKLKYPGIVHTSSGDSSLPYTAQVFDAVNGIALALSDLVSRKLISHKSDALTVRKVLSEKLRSYNSAENGYLSATGTTTKVYFDAKQDGPLSLDVVNLLDAKWKTIGKFTDDNKYIQFITDPIFPGGTTIPVVGAGKVRYQVAAFLPKNKKLGSLAELGQLWESALKSVVSWVNNNDTLTVGFDLTTYDTGISSENCSFLAQQLPTNIDIIIGPARSKCTAMLYNKIESRGVPVFTYASTSSVLSKKSLYPNLFRLCPSDTHQASALSDLFERYSWEKIGIIAEEGLYGEELAADIETLLRRRQIKVTTKQTFKPSEPRLKKQMAALKQAGSAVNLIIANPREAVRLYQEAFELRMVGKGWTWIGSDGATATMFKSTNNLQRAMQGMVGFRPKAGSGKLFHDIFTEWLQANPMADKQLPYLSQIFDSILLPSIALHRLHKEKKITAKVSKVEARMYLLSQLRGMTDSSKSFASTTNQRLYFDSYQDVTTAYDLVNLNGDKWVTVGSYDNGELDITSSVIWPGGSRTVPPSDQPSNGNGNFGKVEEDGGTSNGLIVLAVVFSIFGVLVIIFMIYIVRRVRYRHLYMQSDLNQGGVFSVLYGHTVNRPGVNLLPSQTATNGHIKKETELNDPMIPRHV